MKITLSGCLLFAAIAPAAAQTTTITPNGFGGYRAYTPPTIGSGQIGGTTTTISPDGFGGYRAYTPDPIGSGRIGGETSTIQPNGFGGYTIQRQPRIGD